MPQFLRGNVVKTVQTVYRYRTSEEYYSHVERMQNDGHRHCGDKIGNENGLIYIDSLWEKKEGEVDDLLS